MSKKWKVRISLLLCVVLLNTFPVESNILAEILQVSVYAQEKDGTWMGSSSNPNYSGNSSGSGSRSSSSDSDENKVTYDFNESTGVLVISGNGIIPTGKFYCREDIKKVIIGSGITEIGESAFQAPGIGRVRSLESVVFEEGSQLKKIGRRAFYNAQIKEISLPEGLEIIGEEAFYNNQVNKELIIPASVETLGNRAFMANSALEKVVFSDNSKCIEFSIGLFESCSKIKSITFPAGLKTINIQALNGNTFGELKIPNSVTSISGNALTPSEDSQYGIRTPITVFLDCDSPLKPNIRWVNPYGSDNNPSKVIKHNFTVEDTTKEGALIEAATCTKVGKYHLSCSKCGIVASADEDVYVEDDVFYVEPLAHDLSKVAAKATSCTEDGNIEYYKCNDCNGLFADAAAKKAITIQETVVAKVNHDYEVKTVAATEKSDGESYKECKVCKAVADREVIAKPMVTLSKDILTYTGKTAKPKVTVKGSDGKKIASSNYTVSYSDKSSKKLGNYSVTVKFKGEQYSGKITKKYSISPANVTLKKTSSDKSSISVKWSKGKSNVSGYEISYSTDKNFSSKFTKTITVKSPATTTASIKKLNKKTAYYIRIRTYSTVGKQKVYSEWTKGKLVKTKAK